MNRSVLLIFSWLIIAGAVSAAKIGDPAAPLQVEEWIKGGPVTLADGKGKSVYVVEFWATWCPPCRQSIPHLTEVQAKFKDQGVVVVGISDERPKAVKPFVEKMGAKMAYVVGLDAKGQTSKTYMDAYKQAGIPTAFVIDKAGAVVWVGHPLEGLDKVVEQVVAGTFDPQSVPAPEEEADEIDPLQEAYFEAAARRTGQAEATTAGEKVLREQGNDPTKLNEFAWTILTDETLRQRDYPLAVRAAQRAFEKTNGRDFAIMDTYARALFMTGRTNDAVTMQQKAVALCANPKTRLELQETLAGYQHPVTDPGPDDEAQLRRFTDESLALVAAGRAVPLDQLLAKTSLTPHPVKLTKPSTRMLSGEQLYEQVRPSVIVVGVFSKGEEEEGAVEMATGFIIHESGIFVTNFHVLDSPGAAAVTAMTADGGVYPVKAVLAVSPFADVAICQLDSAPGLKPLPLAANAKPGTHLRVLSHPDGALYSLTEGILSRYFIYRADGHATTMFTTTADFAVGSSGGPLLDDRGNVVGMVSSTSSVYSGTDDPGGEDETAESVDEVGAAGDLQMVLKMCVPAADILKLVTGAPAKP